MVILHFRKKFSDRSCYFTPKNMSFSNCVKCGPLVQGHFHHILL